MLKIILCCFVVLLGTASHGQEVGANASTGSSNKKVERKARKASVEICDCINGLIKTFHPVVRNFLNDMLTKSEAEAMANLKAAREKLSPEEQQKMKQDAERMTQINSGLGENCFDDLKAKYGNENDPKFERAMQVALNSIPKCKMTAKLMELGLKKKGK